MARTDDQARNLAILLSNKLGEKSQLLGLDKRNTYVLPMKVTQSIYMPGLNSGTFQLIAK